MIKGLVIAAVIILIALMHMTPEEFAVARKKAAQASSIASTAVKDAAVAADKQVQKAVDD